LTPDGTKTIELRADPVFRLPPLGGELLPARVFVSTYYDTPSGSLARGSITLRRRQERAASTWRLELPTEDGRIELEEDGGADGIPAEFLPVLVAHLQLGRLVPVATLRTHRTEVLWNDGESRARVVHDRVEVIDGVPGVVDFAEIRVETLSGPPRGSDAIVARLTEAGARETRNWSASLPVPGLPAPEPREQGAWFAEQLDDILSNDPGTRLGVDPEHLHAHRVAIRRLRAALREEPLKSELGWIGGALGAVRDLDVLTDRLRREATLLDGNERTALRPLLARLARRRARARGELVEALESARYFALLAELADVAVRPFESPRELMALAGRQFRRLQRDVAQAGAEPADEALHEVRKRAKRIRYASERAREAGEPSLGKVIEAAKALQDVLGSSQDAVVMEHELRDLVGETSTSIRAIAIGRLIERERAQRETSATEWPDAWRRLERACKKVFRKTGRTPKRRSKRAMAEAPEDRGDPAPAASADTESPR
jgi:CHAD domain-containing protein